MSLLGLVIALLILCVVYWAAEKLMAAFGVGEPIHTVVIVLLVLLILVWAVGAFTGYGPGLRLR
jgi:predicted membrane protein